MKPVLTSLNLFIITAIIVFTFSGCSSETTYILTEEDLTWMAYDNNQVIEFQSNTGLSRTYNVSGRWRGNGNASVNIRLAGDTLANNLGILNIDKGGDGFSVSVAWPHYPIMFSPTSMIAETDTINGTILTDVYYSSTISSDLIRNIREVYYSKAIGVVKFVDKSGVTWTVKN